MSIFNMVRPFGAPRFCMDENATGGDAAPPIVREAPKDTPAALSIEQAARTLASVRRKPAEKPAATPAPAPAPVKPAAKAPEPSADENTDQSAVSAEDPATAGNELSDEGNAASDESQNPGENEGKNAEADKLPPVQRPRSWAKDDEAEWAALPRSLQEKIAAREDTREKALRKGQNEAAEKTKAVTAKEQAAEQARTQYESKLASVREILENEQRRDFPDIKSQQDLDNIAAKIRQLSAEAQALWATDPLAAGPKQAEAMQLQGKLEAWNNHQRKLVAVDHEQKTAAQRQTAERSTKWKDHVAEQNRLAIEKIPDLADATKGKVLRERAVEQLTQIGFTPDELNKLASGEERISVYDHRLQVLLHASLRLADYEKAKETVAAKAAKTPVPPVVRPGARQPTNSGDSTNLKSLNSKLNNSGSLADAVAVLQARRTARR